MRFRVSDDRAQGGMAPAQMTDELATRSYLECDNTTRAIDMDTGTRLDSARPEEPRGCASMLRVGVALAAVLLCGLLFAELRPIGASARGLYSSGGALLLEP